MVAAPVISSCLLTLLAASTSANDNDARILMTIRDKKPNFVFAIAYHTIIVWRLRHTRKADTTVDNRPFLTTTKKELFDQSNVINK